MEQQTAHAIENNILGFPQKQFKQQLLIQYIFDSIPIIKTITYN